MIFGHVEMFDLPFSAGQVVYGASIGAFFCFWNWKQLPRASGDEVNSENEPGRKKVNVVKNTF